LLTKRHAHTLTNSTKNTILLRHFAGKAGYAG